MGVIILIAFFLLLAFIAATCRYKRHIYRGLDPKEHKLIFMLGTGVFIAMHLPKSMLRKYNIKLKGIMSRLKIKDKTDKEVLIYLSEKICLSLLALIAALGLSGVLYFTARGGEEVTSIERPDVSEEEATYKLVVGVEDETQITVSVGAREYTEDEVESMFAQVYELALKDVAGENTDLEHVGQSLNFVTSVSGYNVSISWEPEEPDKVGYDGEILYEFQQDSCITNIFMDLSYGQYETSYTVAVKLIKENSAISIQEEVQEAIDMVDSTKSEVELPNKINGENITYTKAPDLTFAGVIVVGILLAVCIIALKDKDLDKELKERDEELLSDYPEIVNKFVLLLKAGLSNASAWERIVSDYTAEVSQSGLQKRYAYEEMKFALQKMHLGVSETVVYEEFGRRCKLQCYVKLMSLLEQNLVRGGRNFSGQLMQELDSAFMIRKNVAQVKGERAGTKLLIPMVMILVVVLVIIVVPAFLTMKNMG